MGTSSSPSTTTTTQSNPLGQAQMPYNIGLWDAASQATGYRDQPMLGGQYLDALKNQAQGNYDASAGLAQGTVPAALNFANQGLAGTLPQSMLPGGQQIGALYGLGGNAVNTGLDYAGRIANTAGQFQSTAAPYSSGLRDLASQYGNIANLAPGAMNVANPQIAGLGANAAAAYMNPALSSGLRGLASGAYIDPNTNPALAGTISAATNPLVRQYQTATSPQTDSNFSQGGRYGSGAWTNAMSQNQQNLGKAIGDTTSGIVNNAYNQGLQATLGAGSALGNIYNTGVANSTDALSRAGQLGQSGYQLGGQLLGQGYGGAASALQQGGQLDMNALTSMMGGYGSAAQAANQGYGTGAGAYNFGGNLANAGFLNMGSLAQAAPQLSNFPLSQMSTAYNAGWAPLQNFGGLLGSPITPNTVSTQTTPYYTNNLQQAATGIGAIASLASIF